MYALRVRRLFALFLLGVTAGSLVFACGSGSSKDILASRYDAGIEGGDGALIGEIMPGEDAAVDPTIGGPCVDDGQCDDKVPCSFDACDQVLHRCRNTPDDSRCDDSVYCNGREKCLRARGCVPGAVVTCQDGTACTIDRCVEANRSCEHVPRDIDGDGDPDDHCPGGHDCDDLDPNVSGTHPEICINQKDDNCNAMKDEPPCASSQNDSCANPLLIGGPGTYTLSTLGSAKDYATSCSVAAPSVAHDVVAAITIPASGPKDLDVWATVNGTEVSVAIFTACGDPTSERACGSRPAAASIRTRLRGLAPGTYFAVVTTQREVPIELRVDMLDPTPAPTNEACTNATPITENVATTVSIIDPAKDLAGACLAATGELTYALTLAQAADVRVFASTIIGAGVPFVGLRTPHCTDGADELRCRASGALPLFARNLAAGTYVLTVAASAPIDANILVRTFPPTVAPADQTCATAPAAVVNATTPVSLAGHEDAIKDGCLPGNPSAAFALPLSVASDVMLIGRFPQNKLGAVSLDNPGCLPGDVRACFTGGTPVRVSRRNVPPGDYRAVITDTNGDNDTLTVLVRPTVAPTIVTDADACGTAVTIPVTGGYFTGDTTGKNAEFSAGCDAPGTAPGGAPDQVLRLELTQAQRVVFNMDGSTYNTILDIRQGAACPGLEVADACYVGFSGPRSFLDMTLQAGIYWVIIDGYQGAVGPWNLDVRMLPP